MQEAEEVVNPEFRSIGGSVCRIQLICSVRILEPKSHNVTDYIAKGGKVI